MFKIADLADRCIAVLEDQSDFSGGEPQMSIPPLFGNQLSIRSCRAGELAALPQLQFDVMNQSPRRDISKGKGVSWFDVGGRARDHLVSDP